MGEMLNVVAITAVCSSIIIMKKRQQAQRVKINNILAFYNQRQKRKPYRKKTAWVFNMNNKFWEMSVPEMENARFKAKYRVERETFDYLVQNLEHHISKKSTSMRSPIPADKRLGITLHCLKSGADYDTISTAYGIGKSTVGPVLKETCKAICKVFGPNKIKLPTTESEIEDIVDGFQNRWNFPGCVGACDGTHLPIIAPVYCPEDYHNYKGWKSIIMLALVDHMYRFRYVSVGAAGKNSDSSVYAYSSLSSPAIQAQLFADDTDYHIIGDSAFALKETMMKPYPEHRGLSPKEFHFNYRLSRARMVVEGAFGRLKARWRILMKRCDIKTEDMPMVIMTCAILHNICEERNDEVNASWMTEYANHRQEFPQPNYIGRDYQSSATEKRDALAELLFGDGNTRFTLSNIDEAISNMIN